MSFTWQNGRQLSRAQTSEELISYSYNADGIRTRKLRVNGETTDYYLNGSSIITQITKSIVNPDNTVRLDFTYDENSSLLGFAYDGQDYWYIRNGQGDVIGILDKDGNEVVSYTYDSWGAPTSTTGSLAETIGQLNPFRYRGYYFDAELGLYYLNSRYYDPEIGRFINADGFVSAGGSLLSTNMYLYCANNPIHRTDPSGKHFFDVPLSTAALQTMSQSQRDEYYAAKAAYESKKSPVLDVSKVFGAGASVVYQKKNEHSVLPDPLPLTIKYGTKSSTTVSNYGDSTKPISVYAQGRSDNWLVSSVGLKFNSQYSTLTISLGLDNIGISGSLKRGNQSGSFGITANLLECKLGFEGALTKWDESTSTSHSSYANMSVNAKLLVVLYQLIQTGSYQQQQQQWQLQPQS